MQLYGRFRSVPTGFLEELMRENEARLKQLDRERKAHAKAKRYESASAFFLEKYGPLCWETSPKTALMVGTSVAGQGVVVTGVPFMIGRNELVLRPYANRAEILFDREGKDNRVVCVGEAKEGRVDRLSLEEEVEAEELWIQSGLRIPFSEIYMHSAVPIEIVLAREVHPDYRSWADANQQSA